VFFWLTLCQDAQKQEKLTRQIAFITYHIRRLDLILRKMEKEEGLVVSQKIGVFFSTYLSNHEYLSHNTQLDECYQDYLGPDFLSGDEEAKSGGHTSTNRLKPTIKEMKSLSIPQANEGSFYTMFELSYLTKPRERVIIIY
jgi:hypothetical protein